MKIVRGKLPVVKAGIYSDIDIADYHSAAAVPQGEYAVSSSDLRIAWSMSMAHAFDRWAHNPNRAEQKVVRHLILGQAAHHLMLGEDKFASKFVRQPLEYRDLKTAKMKPWNNNADVCKEWNEKQEKRGLTIVKQEELEAVLGMARSLAAEPLINDGKGGGLLIGAVECSGFTKDKETGLWIKVRPDVIPAKGNGEFADLKTIADITDHGIRNAIRDHGYHMQAGLVWEWTDAIGLDFESFTDVFMESKRPHCVRLVPLDDEDIARGRQQCRAMLRKFAECINRGHWPGPGQGELRSIWLPKFEREAIDERLKTEGVL